MKRGIFKVAMLIVLFAANAVNAQKIAVFNFTAKGTLYQSEVDGICDQFTTYFYPQGYKVVERNDLDQVIAEQRFQRSSLTEDQMVSVGKILNVQKIVIGNVSEIRGQINVDVKVVNVETGKVGARDGATWAKGTSIREVMRSLATRMSQKIIYHAPAPRYDY